MGKILIIDDEEPILRMYKEAVSNHQVITAKDGESGIALAEKESPDLILLDIIMPKVNGLDVLENLKKNKNTKDVPVVILTNLPEEASADKARALGAEDYFVKAEYEPDKLADKIDQILQ